MTNNPTNITAINWCLITLGPENCVTDLATIFSCPLNFGPHFKKYKFPSAILIFFWGEVRHIARTMFK